MKFRINAKELCEAIEASSGKSKLKQDCSIEAVQGTVIVRASDGVFYSELSITADVEREGKAVVYSPMLVQLLKSTVSQEVEVELPDNKHRLIVRLNNGAQYLLPLGFEQNDDDPLRSRITALMSESQPVVTFSSPNLWKDSTVVKQFRGEWEFSYILLLPILQQPDWTSRKIVAAVAATDQYILGAVLLTEDQAELYTDSLIFIPPELSSLRVQSFALADHDEKRYIYAIMENGFVSAPTQNRASESMCKTINLLLVSPSNAQLKFDRTTFRNFKKAIETYVDRKTSRSVQNRAVARWDICPDGSHRLWSTYEGEILFTADKAEVIGTIPRTCTFWVNLLDRAFKFIPAPSAIELTFNGDSCVLRLRDEFNYRICVVQSMFSGSDYESFVGGGDNHEDRSDETEGGIS